MKPFIVNITQVQIVGKIYKLCSNHIDEFLLNYLKDKFRANPLLNSNDVWELIDLFTGGEYT